MSKEDEISKALDANTESDSSPQQEPVNSSNGLNGHEAPSGASEDSPQDTEAVGQNQEESSSSLETSEQPKLHNDQDLEGQETAQEETQNQIPAEPTPESAPQDSPELETTTPEPETDTQQEAEATASPDQPTDEISAAVETPASEEPIAQETPSEVPAPETVTQQEAEATASPDQPTDEVSAMAETPVSEEPIAKETPSEAPAPKTDTQQEAEATASPDQPTDEVSAIAETPASEEPIAEETTSEALAPEADTQQETEVTAGPDQLTDEVSAIAETPASEEPIADKTTSEAPAPEQTSEEAATHTDEALTEAATPTQEAAADDALSSTEPSAVEVPTEALQAEVERPSSAPEGKAEVTSEAQETPTPEKPEIEQPVVEQPVWETVDFTTLDKAALVGMVEEMAKHDNPLPAEKASKQLRPHFIKIQKAQRQTALEQFTADGNEPDGFSYRFDELDNRFDAAFKLLRDRKFQKVKDLERSKEKNLEEKTQLLEELRALVEAEETTASINALKKIQEHWRSLGAVPGQHAKTLWANYHALLDLYYDHRSIYFELKELDRKKNLTTKLELCDRAEKLVENQNLREAISELNELHDEFKHIGPVPKKDQEALWQRFKGASDQIYARRKEFVKHLKEDLKENLIKKAELAEEVQQFVGFDSERITDWNKKTQALLELQKRWDAIGGLPRENAKEINRKFWGAFKGFFQHKGQFFKKLEGERGANLEKKQALVTEAAALKDSTDWNDTSNKLKNLQKQWREIGPVPEKQRNEVYAQFKEASDHFFNNRRSQTQEMEKEYVVNLQKKQDICTQIESMTTSKDYDLDKFQELKESFNAIGYVPSAEVRNIREQFKQTVGDYLEGAPEDLQAEAKQLKYDLEFEKLTTGPNASRKKGQKEQSLRREISSLENDVSTWKNNLEFFAASKTADKLREEFTGKIDDATDKLRELKRQLRAVRQL